MFWTAISVTFNTLNGLELIMSSIDVGLFMCLESSVYDPTECFVWAFQIEIEIIKRRTVAWH